MGSRVAIYSSWRCWHSNCLVYSTKWYWKVCSIVGICSPLLKAQSEPVKSICVVARIIFYVDAARRQPNIGHIDRWCWFVAACIACKNCSKITICQMICKGSGPGCWTYTNSPLLRTNRKPQFIATIFTPITKRLSVFYLICGILIAVIVVGQLDLVNSFGKADRESYVNRAVVATCISPLLFSNCKPPKIRKSVSVFCETARF